MDAAVLPDVIQRYLDARDELDTDATLRTFSATAVVADDGAARRGHEQIRRWLETTSTEYTFVRTLIGVSPVGDHQWVVVNNITGNFPGGTVDLAYRFTLHDDLIDELVIAPAEAERGSQHV